MGQSNLSIALHSRPFQMEGARFAMEHRSVVIADEPGLGKTIQSIAAVIGSKTSGSVLIVAPKTAAYVTWPAELNRWLAEVSPYDPIRIIGGLVDKPTRLEILKDTLRWHVNYEAFQRSLGTQPGPITRQWVIVSPNYLRFNFQLDGDKKFVYDEYGHKVVLPVREALTALLKVPWSAVIVDEAHETLAGATGNIKKQSAQSRGIRLLQIKPDGLRIALSGTPFRGKHENLWGILNWIQPKTYTDSSTRGGDGKLPYWRWIHKHFEVFHDDVWNQDIIGNLRSERELAREAKQYMIRRTKKKVAPELPEKFYGGQPLYPNKKPPPELLADIAIQLGRKKLDDWYDKNNPIAIWLPMEGKQKTVYDQMKREAMAHFENGTLLANSILAEMTRLKQFANSYGRLDNEGNYIPQLPSNKFEWILQFLRERGIDGPDPSGSKVVIASQFTKHINLFATELRNTHKIPCYVLTGETKTQDRVLFQNEFQSGKLRTGKPSPEVIILNTKAAGVSITLDAADDMVVIDSTYNVDDQVQLEDRIHRISRVHQVTIWNLASKGTIDQQILRKTRETGRSLKRILNTSAAALELLDS